MAKAKSLVSRPERLWLLLAIVVLAEIMLGICQDVLAAKRAPSNPAYEMLYRPDLLPYPPNMIYPIRVGIASHVPVAHVAVWEPGAVFIDEKPIFILKPRVVYTITPGRLTEIATGQSISLPVNQRARISSKDYKVWAANRWWRGTLEIITLGNKISVINLLDLEEYLAGVVPSEMPSSWHIEALKAQAVAARSYAWAHLGAGSKWWRNEGYDLVPDVRDQAYKGLAAESPSTNKAVMATAGIVLKDSGRVKPGFYRATVGDQFENLNIRKSTVPSATLEKMTGVTGIVGVTVKQYDSAMNAFNIQVLGKKGSREVYGKELARRLGFSTAFWIFPRVLMVRIGLLLIVDPVMVSAV